MGGGGLPGCSVSTVAFDGYPLPVALAAIAECGAKAAELAYIEGYGTFDETAFSAAGAAEARAELARAGLSSVAVSAHIDLGAEGAAERLRRRIGFAAGIGASFLITNAGRRSERDAVTRTLEATLPVCLDAGVVLALENPGHGTDALFGDGADGAALVRALSTPALGLNFDAGNILTYSRGAGSPAGELAAALPYVVHAHLKDVKAVGPDWAFVPLGAGDVGVDGLAATLLAAGRPLGIELPLRLRRPGRADPVRAEQPVPLETIVRAVAASMARLGPGLPSAR